MAGHQVRLLWRFWRGGCLKSSMADRVSTAERIRARREEEKERRRQAILNAAERVVAKHGWEATDFGKIAARARLSRSLVYFYFATRDELFHAMCSRGLANLQRRFAEAVVEPRTGIEKTMALGRAYYAFSREEPLYFEFIAHYQEKAVDAHKHTPVENEAHELGRGCIGVVAQTLMSGIADGTIRKSIGDPRPAAVSIWAFTHGLIQVATRKEVLLQESFQLNTEQMMEHGFALLRSSLAA